MQPGHLKGALLEYLIRKLMINCGFLSVNPDGHYIYRAGNGLYYINGKGAAHDADVLMDPPIQMPFSYPSRLLFECKAYGRTVGLETIRNALGLRYDINEFEIITDASIERRKNNRREGYAISNRKRYHYQVAIGSVGDFSKPAFEFAANNKIPLLSLRWFLDDDTCDLFRNIDSAYLGELPEDMQLRLFRFLKDKMIDSELDENYEEVSRFLAGDDVIGRILRDFDTKINRCAVGLLESGDLIFLFGQEEHNLSDFFGHQHAQGNLEGRLHYSGSNLTEWTLAIADYSGRRERREPYEFRFNVPKRLLSQWKKYNYDKYVGYTMKGEFFSRIFIFSSRASGGYGLPFTLVNLDGEWLSELNDTE